MAVPAKIAANLRNQGSSFTEEEREAAEILIQLSHLLVDSKSPPVLCWGSKRKRSSLDATASPPPPPPPPPPCNGEKNHIKVEASSPATPLSFSPSDTDSKSKRSRRRFFKKKTNKELREIVATLSSQQKQLKHEISKVKDYHDKQRAVNLQLKARQMELGLNRKRDQFDNVFEEQTERLDPAFEEKQVPIIQEPSEPFTEEKQSLIIHHQTSEPSAVNATTVIGNFRYPYVEMPLLSESGLSLQSKHRPCTILDMNFFADEAVSRDFHCKAAIAAQARKRRIEIQRVKSSMALKQPRLR